MRRLSPITIALLVVLVGVVAGAATLLLLRSPTDALAPLAAATPDDRAARADLPTGFPARQTAGLPPLPASATASAPAMDGSSTTAAVADAQTSPSPTDARDAGAAAFASIRGRGLLVAQIFHQRRQAADERAFDAQKLPDTTRSAIRHINDDYAARIVDAWNKPDPPPVPPNASPDQLRRIDAERARHDALVTLLGTDDARAFEAAERVAVQQVRGKFRVEGARALRQQAGPITPTPASSTTSE